MALIRRPWLIRLILQLEPASWDFQADFLIEYHYVFDNDVDEAAHPLRIDLRKLSGLLDIFDFTSYSKGNCMVYMIYHFLGERIFFSSVRNYVRMYHYRNADEEDLWSAFQAEIDGAKASPGLPMKDIMRTWTYQAGFPVLHVQQNQETGAIELTQVRRCLSQIDLQARFFILFRRRQIIYRWNAFMTILIIVVLLTRREKRTLHDLTSRINYTECRNFFSDPSINLESISFFR